MGRQHSTLVQTELHVPFVHGVDASKSATPDIGDNYHANDTRLLNECLADDIWNCRGIRPCCYDRETKITATDQTTVSIYGMVADVDSRILRIPEGVTVALDTEVAASWDTIAGTDYTAAANRAGLDFYIYACQPLAGLRPTLLLSVNSTAPTGYTVNDSRKIGGFHCLCVSVGTIASHTLTGYVQGDVLPESVWDLKHRPWCSPEGMVWCEGIQKWVDIYFASGTGASTVSIYGAGISDTRSALNFIEDGVAVRKVLPSLSEFSCFADGSNQQTSIAGGGQSTTGGHVDSAGRRMISNIGCEGCCGHTTQFVKNLIYVNDTTIYNGTGAWTNLDTGKGSAYSHFNGALGFNIIRAGEYYSSGATAGSHAERLMDFDINSTAGGARFCCKPRTAKAWNS